MTDYRHALQFGSFLTPSADDPQRAVALAVLSEQVGLDLVTFQDHPYQPAFLDTWTLMSFAAARTRSIHLAANVTNLPLRPPAVLARSVASLDRLSGGRVELGLGAGAFWAAIEAMGGRALSGGDAVQATEEAIAVIRQVWDVEGRGGVKVDGDFHRVRGAKRGPAPAHDVAIWLGALKPRMLRLIARAADGWLPSLAYLAPGDLREGNAVIDAAAEDVGRPPAAIRRLLNVSGHFGPRGQGQLHGPAGQWAEELAQIALEDGVSTFILASDDPEDLRRFGGEVAPAVRQHVEAERTHGSSAPHGGPRSQAVPVRSDTGSVADRAALGVTQRVDDGVRRSSVQVWDESSRPSGPAVDPERTFTVGEQAAAQQLVDVHDHLRSEFAEVVDLVDRVEAGAMDAAAARSHLDTMTMRQNNWTLGTFCESYCRVVTAHHSLEDQGLFPYLRHRDTRLGPVLERLQQEHQAIHDVIEGVDDALASLVSARGGGMTQLRASVDLLGDTLLSHLAYEERELLEPLARLGMPWRSHRPDAADLRVS